MTQGYSHGELPLYYETHGSPRGDRPSLLLIHGGGSTIESNWGLLIPSLAGGREIIALEWQGHGRTGTIDRVPSFEATADDIAVLLDELGRGPVDVLGFSNGGQIAMQLAVRRPELVHRLIAASAPYRPDGMIDGFWAGLEGATFADLPHPYVEADLAVSGDPAHVRQLFDLDRTLMLSFTAWPDALPASITAPTLVVGGDRDVVTTQHLARLARLIPGARLLIVPGTHGSYLGEVLDGSQAELDRTLPHLIEFLDAD
ncbi:MAG TPA: alpha/beta hydrolase [Pseudolysinimonas sp.]|nr:alpha/beta hydrolase [Pseudolysinimonas sp.]